MIEIDLRAIDLNLLVSAEVLLREANISRAAEALRITQPAASQRLARLRDLFDDPLLVRRGGRMVPTPLAEELRTPIERALGEVQAVLTRRSAFVPATARRRFEVAITDLGATTLLPGLLAHLLDGAPGVGIDARVLDPVRYDVDLERGHDLAIGVLPPRTGIRRRQLFREDFLCLVRRGHPLLAGRRTARRFAQFGHVVMSPSGGGPGPVDNALGRRGESRHVALRVATFAMSPAVLETTDAVMTLPSLLARHYAAHYDLETFAPPLRLNHPFAVHAAWSERSNGDPGLRWLIEQLVAVGP